MYIRLMSLGYTMEDIATVALETQKIRMQRAETLQKCNKKWGMGDKFTIIAEIAKRKLVSKLKLFGIGNIGKGISNNNNKNKINKSSSPSTSRSSTSSSSIKIASYASRSA